MIAFAAKKKNADDITQTLELPKDPPAVAVGETSRLVFHVSPLSAKGLLSQQTRDALKAILKANGGAPVIHLRAFVAGSGDVRRVPQIARPAKFQLQLAQDRDRKADNIPPRLAGGTIPFMRRYTHIWP